MTSAAFRRIALGMPEAEEQSHMDHPDFRVNGRIFATLGYPGRGYGALMITPLEQARLMDAQPGAFSPAAGKWGKSGSTIVYLPEADVKLVRTAIESAWRRRAPARLLGARPSKDSKQR